MNRVTANLLCWMSCISPAAASGVTSASVSPSGIQGNGPSGPASLSADGRFVAFDSGASNLVAGDVNEQWDVFVHDRVSGTNELVALDMQGQPTLMGAEGSMISSDGRFVVFASWADDLTPNDTNGWLDVFLRDRQLGVTECISVHTNNSPANHVSRRAAVSANGRFVAFESRATSLVSAPDLNLFQEDVFVRDRQTGVTEMVSVDSNGNQGNSFSGMTSISADGRFVAFDSNSNNLVAGDTNGLVDVFVRDRLLGTTVRVSVSSGGVQADNHSTKPVLSGDGRFVAFESLASNLAPGDTNGTWDIYVRDLAQGITFRASVDSSGVQGGGHSFLPHLDHSGRYLVFEADDAFDPSDTNGFLDVFVRDLQLGQTRRVSVTSLGAEIATTSFFPAISADGSTIAFTTGADLVVPGDANAFEDVFVHAWSTDWTAVCIGDGSASACPCGNDSAVGEEAGCLHSLGSAGRLSAVGTPSVTSDSFVLLGAHMPNGPVLYLQGTSVIAGGLGQPFGDGLLCASGSFTRLGTKFNALGASALPGAGDLSISVAGSCTAGASRSYQGWYRDAALFCQSPTFNFTNGLSLIWRP